MYTLLTLHKSFNNKKKYVSKGRNRNMKQKWEKKDTLKYIDLFDVIR